MRCLSIKEALEEPVEEQETQSEHCIYLYRDQTTAFYVGQAPKPFRRLHTHLGDGKGYPPDMPTDTIGRLIRDNEPDSSAWQVWLLTFRDCFPDLSNLDPSDQSNRRKVEERLIRYCRPVCNYICNRSPSPLLEQHRHVSCLIGYANPDEVLAKRLYKDLQDNDIRCWMVPDDGQCPADYRRSRIDKTLLPHEKVLRLLPKHTVNSSRFNVQIKDHKMTLEHTILFDWSVYSQAFATLLQHLRS